MASTYSFPILTRKEIADSLLELNIAQIREEDLTNPNPDFVFTLYTNILISLDPFQDDDGQADFHALAQLENPDYHRDSVRTMNLCKKIRDLVAAVRCHTNFTVKDLVKPDTKRTGIFLSALLNFFCHRESRLNLIREYGDQLDVYEDNRAKLEARILQLNNEISEINAASEREQPFAQELDDKVKELRKTIQGLNNLQMSLKGSFFTLRDKAKEIDEKITSADFTLAQSAQENAKVRSKIIQSPEKLQGALEDKKSIRDEMKNSERSAMQSYQEKTTTLEVYSKACKKMAKFLTQMQAIQEQVTSAKTIDRDVKELQSKLSGESVQDKSLDAKLIERQGHVEQMKRSWKVFEKERDLKHDETTKELNSVKLEVELKKRNMESRKKRVEAMHAEVGSINSKVNSVIESGVLKQRELYRSCEEIVNEFHNYLHPIGVNMQIIEAGLQVAD